MIQSAQTRNTMKEKHKITTYPSKNKKTETYIEDNTSVTKHYYDAKDAYVKEFISITDGVKKVKHITRDGVTSKLEHFVDEKRDGQETKYFVSKADGTVKSTKLYENGKLHGENITYNESGKIIKHELFALGKRVLKYLREDDDSSKITSVEMIDKESVQNLPKNEYEKLQTITQSLSLQ